MPFIRGRYHINPIAGEALEAAREMEEALARLQHDNQDSDPDEYEWEPHSRDTIQKDPVHRVEIEAASLVPTHSGQATHGFVARVHRAVTYAPGQSATFATAGGGIASARGTAPVAEQPETHVFANDSDLVDFLQRELAKDRQQRDCGRA